MDEKQVISPGVIVSMLGGYCPVQAEGTIDSVPFYFRARGNQWSLSVGGSDVIMAPDWYYEEPYGEMPFDAGWLYLEEAKKFILEGAEKFRSSPSRA